MSRVKISVAKWVGAFLLSFCSFSYSNAQISTAPGQPPIIERQFYDDTYVNVPLQFGFPFYGRTFTNSWMHSNGVVSFLDPAVPVPNAGYNPGQWAYCCQGIQPSGTRPEFSFMIAPLWTDLYPVGQSRFMTQGDSTFQRYYWENIAEISNMSNLNTFGLEIRPSGFIGAYYDKVNIQNQQTWSGIIGDPALNQWTEKFYGVPGLNAQLSAIPNWSVNNTPRDICASNPLSSPTCPGYTEAMCASNPLYSSSCSGYQQAYFNQQCSANPLYNTMCPGYAAAYLTYMCSADPLYSTTCAGYEQAYFDQQCLANSLYSTQCPGYQQAYFSQQCSLNPLYSTQCAGYETAYFNLQCSISPLYSRTCPGYEQAYFNQQCTANALYSTQCSGYQQAYFNQQCTLNGLYSTQCPNYAEAYATAEALKPKTETTTTTTTSTATATTTPTVESSGEIKIAVVADPVVNSVVTQTATSASPAAAATATVPLVQAPSTTTTTTIAAVAVEEKKTEEKKTETKTESTSTTSTQTASADTSSKEQPKTARQELQERRVAAAKARAVEDGKNLASNMGKVASMEQQVAVQNVVIAAMGFTPGFDAYNKVMIVQVPFYKPEQIYKSQVNVDNKIIGRRMFGGTDRLHAEMVDAQYNLGK